ncbi:MAG: pyruvate kinase [Mogibacterium sp.]|nr:pyruvate kinase [Mogibacterium sp.]MBQ6315192.1 pyruvate kinase [Mogibacterium sp.]
MNKVKIYGTLGPACSDPEVLKKMFSAGMDGIRLNLSHATLEESGDMVRNYHLAAEACGIRAELLIDLQGPELRIGRLIEPVHLSEGSLISLDAIPFPDNVLGGIQNRDGQEILLDDGKILLQTEGDMIRVIRGGVLEGRKSIALPGRSIDTPALTGADIENIRVAKRYGVTAVMQPFVRSKDDLAKVRSALEEAGCGDIRIMAKIENLTGLAKIEELIPYCDEIVIARGDLGNAMELWELPAAQKRISSACRRAGRDFMVVTQMLESMTHRQVPSRAEVSDIFNAVLDGASSVMVTGETAAGEYPELVISYMAHTVREAEKYLQ